VAMMAVSDVKPMPPAISNRVSVSVNDGVWEGDSAAAKRVGSGHY